MNDDDVLKRAAKWLGEDHAYDEHSGAVVLDTPEGPWMYTNADLAEAVRVKFIGLGYVVSDETADIALEWMFSGPIAFMRAVMEVVDA